MKKNQDRFAGSSFEQIAAFMLERLKREKYLYQEIIVCDIENIFGKDYVYVNDNGNLAIHTEILKSFRRQTKGQVVWERGEKLWRFRESFDPKDRRQVE